MSKIYDGIILGAGHNSLVLQAYLGKAGLKVLCLERKPIAGGGLSTMEDPRHPGFFTIHIVFPSSDHLDAMVRRPGSRSTWRPIY